MMPLHESSMPPRTAVRFSPSSAAGWALVLLVLQGVGAAIVRPSGSTGPVDFVGFSLVIAASTLVVLFGMVRVHGPDSSLREVLGLSCSPLALPPGAEPAIVAAHRAAVVALLLVVGVALVPVDAALDAFFSSRDPSYGEELSQLTALLDAPTMRAKVARSLGLGVVQPLAELTFYFGMVFGGLRRPGSRVLASLLSTTFFVLHASDLRTAPLRLLIALPILGARLATGEVRAAVLAAVVFNMVSVANVGRSESLVRGGVALWAGVLALAFAGILFLVRRATQWRLGEFADRLDMRA